MFEDYCKKQAYSGIELDYFIKTYGEKEGTEKYENMLYLKVKAGSSYKGYSKISQKMFAEIDAKLGDYAKDSKWATKNGEEIIKINTGYVKPDYILGNKIIEFNGDFWHMNSKTHLSNDFNNVQNKQASEIWESDNFRTSSLEKLGYKIKTVWEHEYRSDPEKTLSECCSFLSDKTDLPLKNIQTTTDNLELLFAL